MTTGSHARRLVAALDDEVRLDIASDPLSAIEVHFGLTVTPAASFAERGAGGWCDGMSETKAGIILYRRTPSRRENFTLVHELAHHLVDDDEDCPSWLADQPDPPRLLEEVCDHIASDLLIAPEIMGRALDGRPPSAQTIAALHESTRASRTACAIAVAKKLPCDGFVLLTERGTNEVFAAARTRDTRPYAWRGHPIPAAHPLRWDVPPTFTKTWWQMPATSDRRDFYMSTTDIGGYTCAVFAENDLWDVERLHTYTPVEPDRGNDAELRCPCGYTGTTRWWPCPECGVPTCPRCKECECARRARREARGVCDGCTASVRAHLLVDGLCDDCR